MSAGRDPRTRRDGELTGQAGRLPFAIPNRALSRACGAIVDSLPSAVTLRSRRGRPALSPPPNGRPSARRRAPSGRGAKPKSMPTESKSRPTRNKSLPLAVFNLFNNLRPLMRPAARSPQDNTASDERTCGALSFVENICRTPQSRSQENVARARGMAGTRRQEGPSPLQSVARSSRARAAARRYSARRKP